MRNYKILLSLLSVLITLTSCEGLVQGNGKIVSSTNNKPIEGVEVRWTAFNEKTYSDNNGRFEVGSFCGCVPECPKLEVIFYKKGYETQYIDLQKKYNYQTDSLTIKMKPSSISKELEEGQWSFGLQGLLIIISIFNVYTLGYIIFKKTKYRTVWIIAMLIFSMTIEYNYFNGEHNIDLFNFLLQFSKKFGWYKFFIPTTAIVFWTNKYLDKKYEK